LPLFPLVVFLKGLIIGFAMAVPVGPVGLLCIRHSRNHGLRNALLAGLGAARGDALLAAIAAAGLASVHTPLLSLERELYLAGGAFLVLLGAWTFFRHGDGAREAPPGHGAVVTAFLLIVTNPTTLFAFLGFFAALGVGVTGGQTVGIAALTVGVFAGSGLWWILLSVGVGTLRRRIDAGLLGTINRVSAVAIAGFGIFVLLDAVFLL
jgi:threonine/homoserine/homoserine lactone efflux protein